MEAKAIDHAFVRSLQAEVQPTPDLSAETF